jgi:hypothetical protein
MNESERNELILAKLTEIDRLIGETRDMFHDEATGIFATLDRIDASLQRTSECLEATLKMCREREAAYREREAARLTRNTPDEEAATQRGTAADPDNP